MLDEPSNPQNVPLPNSKQEQSLLRWTWAIWLIFAAMLAFQPNYAWIEGSRTAPYGSDFVQEWIGAKIILSEQPLRLYDWDHATRLQHDPDVVGYHRGGDGYYPMVYPPYWYIACAPFALIPLKYAAPIWLGLMTAVWFFGLRWAIRSDGRLGRAISRAPQLALISGPILLSYGLGQKSVFLVMIVLATAVFLEQGKIRRAGLICALLAFKPHLLILLGVPLTLRFGLRFLTGCLATSLGLVLLTYAINGALLGEFLHVALESVTGDYSSHAGYRLDDAHNWAGLWARMVGLGSTAKLLTSTASIATFAAMCVVAVRRLGKTPNVAEWGVFTCGLVLASPHFYGYDLAILLVPAYFLIREFDETPSQAIGVGAGLWYAITVLPHLSKGDAVPVQWSATIVLISFAACLTSIYCWNIAPLGKLKSMIPRMLKPANASH